MLAKSEPLRSRLDLEKGSVERSGRRILDQVAVSFGGAELTAIVGPNGAGKTTLLRVLCGLCPLSDGSMSLEGRSLTQWRRREIALRIAYLPQSSRPQFGFLVRQVVAMGRFPVIGTIGRRDRTDEEAVAAAMDRCGVGELAERSVLELSGGELQRVLLARALATQSGTLLLDEPTVSLDLEHELELFSLLRDLVDGGHNVIVTLHDLNAAVRFASRVVVLSEGILMADGSPSEVLTDDLVAKVFGVRQTRLEGPQGDVRVFF